MSRHWLECSVVFVVLEGRGYGAFGEMCRGRRGDRGAPGRDGVGVDIETVTIAASVLERLTLVFSGRTLAFGELAPNRGPTTLPRGLIFNRHYRQ